MQRHEKGVSLAVRVARAVILSPLCTTAPLILALGLNPISVQAQQTAPSARISLERAIELALEHNHALQAARTTIQQNQAQEITANLRPNPVLSADYTFVPVFSPSYFGQPISNIPLPQEADVSVAYNLEFGKRQARLAAAKAQTAVTRSTLADNERNLTFQVASQFISVLLAEASLDSDQQDLTSFQKNVAVSQERQKAGDISQGDLLKIQLQLLQFQAAVSTDQLNRIQSLAALRQLLGYESVPDEYDVDGQLDYQPVHVALLDLKALALRTRPDLRAAQLSVTGAQSQLRLARTNGRPDVTPQIGYSQVAGDKTVDFTVGLPLPLFDRNQGEVARTRSAVTQAEQLANENSQQVLTDVVDAYAGLHSSAQIVEFYRGGYLQQAKLSRDISEYAYSKGGASLLDFLDAERTYRANQLAYHQTLAAYMTALEQLRQAVGTRSVP